MSFTDAEEAANEFYKPFYNALDANVPKTKLQIRLYPPSYTTKLVIKAKSLIKRPKTQKSEFVKQQFNTLKSETSKTSLQNIYRKH